MGKHKVSNNIKFFYW